MPTRVQRLHDRTAMLFLRHPDPVQRSVRRALEVRRVFVNTTVCCWKMLRGGTLHRIIWTLTKRNQTVGTASWYVIQINKLERLYAFTRCGTAYYTRMAAIARTDKFTILTQLSKQTKVK
jgi:hypothetical protein